MRTIKFRGRLSNGEWRYGDLITYKSGEAAIANFSRYGYECSDMNRQLVGLKTVGQFTGLFDKHGHEIYEGDIVRHDENGKCYSIIYEEPMFRFAPNDDCFAFLNHPELLEVVGNIYDNKSLIEKGGNQ